MLEATGASWDFLRLIILRRRWSRRLLWTSSCEDSALLVVRIQSKDGTVQPTGSSLPESLPASHQLFVVVSVAPPPHHQEAAAGASSSSPPGACGSLASLARRLATPSSGSSWGLSDSRLVTSEAWSSASNGLGAGQNRATDNACLAASSTDVASSPPSGNCSVSLAALSLLGLSSTSAGGSTSAVSGRDNLPRKLLSLCLAMNGDGDREEKLPWV
mmetsp:Transcript_59869/g.160278  ORF Transcript_59869/g.160278 Transcript_59869/m.160278 type:complete len:216 (+) Transcript_59869:227-874(+)